MTIPPQTLQEETPTRTPEQAEQLCARLMENTGEMVALLDRETALLRNGKPHEITALQARKTALSTALTRDMNTFRQNSGYIRAAAPAHVEALKEQHLVLQKSLTANQDALTAMKAVSESLLHMIASKLGESRSGPEVYGKNAGVARQTTGTPTAISFDETL